MGVQGTELLLTYFTGPTTYMELGTSYLMFTTNKPTVYSQYYSVFKESFLQSVKVRK